MVSYLIIGSGAAAGTSTKIISGSGVGIGAATVATTGADFSKRNGLKAGPTPAHLELWQL
jgi:hypothetical protein